MNKKRHPAVWGFTTYFAEGLPYTIIRQISSFFLRDSGVALESIGLTSLFGIPWILKFLWAPLLDRYGTKRQWMISMQVILTLLFILTSIAVPLPTGPMVVSTLFFVASFFAATNDVAIDGYYLEVLDDEGQATFVGYRVMAYRLAMLFGTGVIGAIGPRWGWTPAFAISALVFGAHALFHFFYLEETQKATFPIRAIWISIMKPKNSVVILIITAAITYLHIFLKSETYSPFKSLNPLFQKISFPSAIAIVLSIVLIVLILLRKGISKKLEANDDSFYAKAYLAFIDRPKIEIIFTAIIFIRTGEFLLSSMISPFFVDLGIKMHYWWISGTIGLMLSIIGAITGGAMIKKFTFKRVLWPFLLLQNLTNLIYMALALFLSSWIDVNSGATEIISIGSSNITLVAVVQGFDQFSGGLGTAVLTMLLMRLCVGKYKAAHFAIGTAFMSVSGVIAGIFGGVLAGALGYGWFFGVSFILSVPGMIAVAFLPKDLVNKV